MPVPVARKLLSDSNRLVASAVASSDEATAAAADGVNILFLQVADSPAGLSMIALSSQSCQSALSSLSCYIFVQTSVLVPLVAQRASQKSIENLFLLLMVASTVD